MNDARQTATVESDSFDTRTTAPSTSNTTTTLADGSRKRPGRAPASTTPLQGGHNLSRVCSDRIEATEAMLARVGTQNDYGEEQEALRRTKSGDEEKGLDKAGEGAVKDGREAEEPWTYPDGGWRAWSVVFGCFCFASCQMAYGLTWGVYQTSLKAGQFKDVPLSTLSLIMGCANFVMYAFSFVAGRLGDRYGYKRMIAIGAVSCFLMMVISAFVSFSLPLLFVFQGVGLGMAHGIGMPLFMSFSSSWFLKRRGLATGIATSGTGFGGAIGTLIYRALIPKLGYRNTLLTHAGINAGICLLAFPLLRERLEPLKEGQTRTSRAWIPREVLRNGVYWSVCLTCGIGIFGYLTPPYYLTSYTTLTVSPPLDTASLQPVLPLVVFNLFAGCGRIAAGFLADQIGSVNSLFLSYLLGGIFQVLFWPFANTMGKIIAFAALEGLVSSWALSLTPVVCASLFGTNNLATIVGFVVLINAPGCAIAPTLSGLVLTGSGGSYQAVAFFSGACMLAGATCLLYARFKTNRSLFARV